MREIRHKRRENESGVFVTTIQGVYVCVWIYIPILCGPGLPKLNKKGATVCYFVQDRDRSWSLYTAPSIEYIERSEGPSFLPSFQPNPNFCLLLCVRSRGHPLCASVQHTSYGMVYYYYYIRNEFFCMNSQRKLVGIIIIDRRTYREWGGWGWWYGDERFPPRLLFLSLRVGRGGDIVGSLYIVQSLCLATTAMFLLFV